MATPALNSIPSAAPAAAPRQTFVYKSVLTLYRVFAVVVLYAILIGILSYAFIMGFYAVNSTWAAPVILSASDEKSLDFLQKLVTSRQAIEDLHVDIVHQQATLDEMTKHRAALEALEPELNRAIARDRSHDNQTGPQLEALDAQKKADNAQTKIMLAGLEQQQARVDRDLANGLITKSDAATAIASINQARDGYTDSRIAEVLLTDNVADKTDGSTKALNVVEKQAELQSEIAQLDVTLAVSEKQLEEDNRQVTLLRSAIATARESPYYLNASGTNRLYFAFVPYDNQTSAKVGTPIYDCYLDMVLCRKVGTVKQIFLGEEDVTHPIFKTQVRGLMIQMELSHPNSAKSKTVFLGRKPLLF